MGRAELLPPHSDHHSRQRAVITGLTRSAAAPLLSALLSAGVGDDYPVGGRQSPRPQRILTAGGHETVRAPARGVTSEEGAMKLHSAQQPAYAPTRGTGSAAGRAIVTLDCIARGLRRLAIVLTAALLAGAGLPGPIAHADPSYTTIDGKALGVDIRYPDSTSGKMDQEAIPSFLLPSLTTPLNQQFDQIWNGTTDNNGETMRDRTCDAAEQQVKSIVANEGQSAYDIMCALAPTGTLRAMVQPASEGPLLSLSYWLPDNQVSFIATQPDCGGTVVAIFTLGASCVATGLLNDPEFTVSFDGELLITMTVPATPCTLTPHAVARVHNASINAEDLTANIAKDFEPSGFAQGVEDLDSTARPISLAPLQSALDKMATTCTTAANDYGFSQFDAVVTAANGLVFRLTHPEDKAPTLGDASAPHPAVPELTSPSLGVSAPEVKAGGQLTLIGGSFTSPQPTTIQVGWDDTLAGTVTESDLEWGPKGGPPQPVTIPRAPYDHANSWSATGLDASTMYAFRVRDCELVESLLRICTPYSAPLDVKTAAAGSNAVDFYLDGTAAANRIAGSTVQPDGTFATPVTIAAATPAGAHTLYAQVPGSGEQASVGITVVGATASLAPSIEVVDPTTDTVETVVGQGNSFTVLGAGFTPGTVTLTLGTATGQVLGTAKAGSDGTFKRSFKLPQTVTGTPTIVASEAGSGQALQATTTVTVSPTPK